MKQKKKITKNPESLWNFAPKGELQYDYRIQYKIGIEYKNIKYIQWLTY